ncbi:hypothetical protein BS78_04G168100 [Paspalum vaginatum]|nr:hypothetical protein BS78_04G168100 [Paspalum vaginatum]
MNIRTRSTWSKYNLMLVRSGSELIVSRGGNSYIPACLPAILISACIHKELRRHHIYSVPGFVDRSSTTESNDSEMATTSIDAKKDPPDTAGWSGLLLRLHCRLLGPILPPEHMKAREGHAVTSVLSMAAASFLPVWWTGGMVISCFLLFLEQVEFCIAGVVYIMVPCLRRHRQQIAVIFSRSCPFWNGRIMSFLVALPSASRG